MLRSVLSGVKFCARRMWDFLNWSINWLSEVASSPRVGHERSFPRVGHLGTMLFVSNLICVFVHLVNVERVFVVGGQRVWDGCRGLREGVGKITWFLNVLSYLNLSHQLTTKSVLSEITFCTRSARNAISVWKIGESNLIIKNIITRNRYLNTHTDAHRNTHTHTHTHFDVNDLKTRIIILGFY